MNNEMLLARRRILMAKKKPSYHVWDGSRDYSFLTESNTLYINTPKKYAGLMAVSLNLAQYDNRPDLVDAHLLLTNKTVKLTKDLYFNEDYLDSNNYVEGSNKDERNGEHDNDRDLTHHNLAYTTFGDGIVRTLYLQVSNFNFDGQFHKIVGLYSNLSNESANMSYSNPSRYLILTHNNSNIQVTAKNFTLEHCVMKNGCYDYIGYNFGVSLIYVNSVTSYPITLSNISAKSCTVCGGRSQGGYASRQILLQVNKKVGGYAEPNVRNVNTQDCNAYVRDSSGYWYEHWSGLVISHINDDVTYNHIASTSDFMFSTECRIAYSSTFSHVIDNRFKPTPSHIYHFGNTGSFNNRNPQNLQTMSSKAALIAQVNADITANASGDLSLLDENGNFTGVCP